MNRNELRKADINLMVVFETIMQERNLTRTGEKLSQTQATISACLNRLRAIYNDPLFTRVGNRMEPTARAKEIIEILSPALDALSSVFSVNSDFDPYSSYRTFHVGLQDDVVYALLPSLHHAIRLEAPNVKIVIQKVSHNTVGELLVSGSISVGVCLTRDLPANAKRKLLRNVHPMVIRTDRIPGRVTMEDFCARPHMVVSRIADVSCFADEWLAEMGLKRNSFVSVSQFSTLPALMAQTNFLSYLPDYLGLAMERQGLVRCEPMPFETPTLPLSMTWLSISDSDPAEQWLRTRIQDFMGVESRAAH